MLEQLLNFLPEADRKKARIVVEMMKQDGFKEAMSIITSLYENMGTNDNTTTLCGVIELTFVTTNRNGQTKKAVIFEHKNSGKSTAIQLPKTI